MEIIKALAFLLLATGIGGDCGGDGEMANTMDCGSIICGFEPRSSPHGEIKCAYAVYAEGCCASRF